MSPAILTAGSSGGDSIGFEPHEAFAQAHVYKLVGCGLCPKYFLTLTMAPKKLCDRCTESEAKRLEEWNKPVELAPKISLKKVPEEEQLRRRNEYQRKYQRNYRKAKRALNQQQAMA